MKNEIGVILMIIVCAITSIVFGVFAYSNFKVIDGTPPDPATNVQADKDKSLADQISDEKKKTLEKEDKIRELTDLEQKLKEEIAKQQRQIEFYHSEADAFRKAHEKRLDLKKGGQEFEQQIKAVTVKVTEGKQKTLKQIEDDITQTRQDMDNKLKDVDTRISGIKAEVEAKKTAYSEASKRHVKEMNYVNSQLGESKQELRDLTTREVIHAPLVDRPDGKVVLSDVEHNFVSINLGTGDGVKNGFRFEVYVMLPGNKHSTKAYIEVVNAGEKQSQCTVLRRPVILPVGSSGYVATQPEEKYDPMAQSGKKGSSAEPMTGSKVVMSGQDIQNPIVEGDLIQNPFYEPGRQLVFYIAGSKEVIGERQKSAIYYRWTEIRDAAERYGAKVISAADTSLNYVIAQKNPQEDPEFKKAVDLGIPVVYEWELFRFIENN